MQNAAGLPPHSTAHPPRSPTECKSALATRTHPEGACSLNLAAMFAVLAPEVIHRGGGDWLGGCFGDSGSSGMATELVSILASRERTVFGALCEEMGGLSEL